MSAEVGEEGTNNKVVYCIVVAVLPRLAETTRLKF